LEEEEEKKKKKMEEKRNDKAKLMALKKRNIQDRVTLVVSRYKDEDVRAKNIMSHLIMPHFR
jgi:hypothetical protein